MLAKMSEKSKLKLVSSDESSAEERDSGPDDLGFTLDKLNLGPKNKLLVLCLGGLLVRKVHDRDIASFPGLRPDCVCGKNSVFKRPFCTEFLKFCFERFEVALWSSARERNIDALLSNITGGAGSKFLFVWSQEECTDSLFHCLENEDKPLFVKEMKKIWGSKYYKGYSAKNTLLIDHEPHISLLNPANAAIFCSPYNKPDEKDTFLRPGGEFRKYLDALADAEDVPSYVKDHPFGQPAITSSHPNWNYYSRVVCSFSK